MRKYAVAGYDEHTKKLVMKVLEEDETIDLLTHERHFTWEKSKIDQFKAEAASKKGYYVDFNNGRKFRVIAIV